MKITRYLALAAMLIVCLLGVSAFAPGSPPGFDYVSADAASEDSVLQLHSEDQRTPAASAVGSVDSVLRLHKAWVREHVGVMPLTIYRAETVAVNELQGYGTVELKPKIGFNGLAANRFARFGV